tara:strand:+ start:102 stop:608 length:507 start_codon:yes stop_codon:yes gene_type:complete
MADDLANLYNPVPTPVDLGQTPAPVNTGRFDPNFASNVVDPLMTGQKQANLPIGYSTGGGPTSYDAYDQFNVGGAVGANATEVKTDIKDFVPESEQMTTDLIEARDEGGRSGKRQAMRDDRQGDRDARKEEHKGVFNKERRGQRRADRRDRKLSKKNYKADWKAGRRD